jgi:TetR/AcrR family transcriptional regulator, transcriptional repressor for nem operon
MARPREFDIDQALDLAMRTFWQHGYQGTSVFELMKAAGVQKQSLYCAFGDKHSLFVKSIELYRKRVLAQVSAMIRHTPSPVAAIENIMRFAVEPAKAKGCPEGCLAANTALELGLRDSEAVGEVKKLFQGLEQMLGEAIKEGQKKGEITPRFESGLIAQSLVNTLNGIRILEKTGGSVKQMNAIVDMALAAIKV